MAVLVQLSGIQGTGKTYSLKTLAERYPDSTYVINCDSKPLAWTGWRKEFSKEKRNYAALSDARQIIDLMQGIAANRPDIKVIVVDTISTIMTDREMEEMKRSGFDKWRDNAVDIYELYKTANELRDDLIVVFVSHIEPYDVDGTTHWRTKTGGKKLTNINLGGKVSYNLYTSVERNGENTEFYFTTQNNGRNEARSVAGVLPNKLSNDLGEVVHLIRKHDLNIEDEQ